MKRYVKPDVLFEDYEMSVGVAACSGLVIGSNGLPKNPSSPEVIQLIEFGLFGNSCDFDYNTTEDYAYFGGLENMFGS